MSFFCRLISCLLILFISCRSSDGNNQTKKSDEGQPSGKAGTSMVEISSSPCAILYVADSAKLASFKQRMGEDFYTAADDHMWYVAEAREFFEKKDLQLIETQQTKLTLTTKNGRTVQLNIPAEYWSALYFYDGVNAPEPADLTMVEDEYNKFTLQLKRDAPED